MLNVVYLMKYERICQVSFIYLALDGVVIEVKTIPSLRAYCIHLMDA